MALNLEQTQYDQGAVQLQLWAETATDATPANDLTIFIQPMMDGMSHPLDLVDFVGQGEGAYLAEVVLDMSGLWTLSGYASVAQRWPILGVGIAETELQLALDHHLGSKWRVGLSVDDLGRNTSSQAIVSLGWFHVISRDTDS